MRRHCYVYDCSTGHDPDLERLMGLAITDKDFRAKLLADPEAAVRETNLNLSEQELANLKAGVEKVKREATDQDIDRYFVSAAGYWA